MKKVFSSSHQLLLSLYSEKIANKITALTRLAFGIGLSCLVTYASPVYGQRTCGSDYQQQYQNADVLTKQRMNEVQQQADAHLSSEDTNRRAGEVITIPVVVHIVHNTPAENLTNAQIQSQLTVLNEDFRLLNADRSNIPSAFAPLATDYRLQFVLASVDPNGNTTNGITRTFTNVTSFGASSSDPTYQAVKFTERGGINAWRTDTYLNIWVCDIAGGVLGYAQFPGGTANTDGVVIDFNSFGRGGSAQAPFNQGRTATHEVGHWLNLRHIWGDANCGNDLVNDTPTQQTSNFNCPAFPRITCSNGPNGDMFMNYMDYTDDACMFMFSNGQRLRSEALFVPGGARESLYINSNSVCPSARVIDQPITASGSYEAASTLTASSSIANGLTVVYQANNQVELSSGFSVNSGGDFRAIIGTCSSGNRDTFITSSTASSTHSTSSQSDAIQKLAIQLYPNPTQDVLNIDLPKDGNGSRKVVIHDSQGREVQRVTMEPEQTTLDVRGLPVGIYYLRIDQGHKVASSRFRIE